VAAVKALKAIARDGDLALPPQAVSLAEKVRALSGAVLKARDEMREAQTAHRSLQRAFSCRPVARLAP